MKIVQVVRTIRAEFALPTEGQKQFTWKSIQ